MMSFYFQLIIQYWQQIIAFIEQSRYSMFYSVTFFLILMVQSLAGVFVRKIASNPLWIQWAFAITMMNAIGLFLTGRFNIPLVMINLLGFFFLFRMLLIIVDGSINEQIDNSIRSTYFSIRSTLARSIFIILAPLVSILIAQFGIHAITGMGVVVFGAVFVQSVRFPQSASNQPSA
jgi:hypothetical protein